MKCKLVLSNRDRLDSLFDRVGHMNSTGKEMDMVAHWCRYLCVLVGGLLEVAVSEVFMQFARKRTRDECVLSALRVSLDGVFTPKTGRIIEVTGWFSKEWAKELEGQISDKHKEAVNSIIANRHRIAHGENSDISYYRLRDWYSLVIEVIEMLENKCGI